MSIKILYVASECSPIAKVGGLGDVAGSLPIALKKLSIDIRVVIPRYGGIKPLPFIPGSKVPVYYIENKEYFAERKEIYGYKDDPWRFAYFSRQVIENLKKNTWNFQPQIIHCNDWHTSLIPLIVKKEGLPYLTLLTVHNLGFLHQGVSSLKALESADLTPFSYPTLKKDAEDKRINFLLQGILNSDFINTVSPTYRKEIQRKEFGDGLDKFLRQRRKRLFGILNGIDIELFDPKKDKNLAKNYSSKTWSFGKKENKKALQKICGLEENSSRPIIASIGRLEYQKGVDLLSEGIRHLVKMGCQIVVLGRGARIDEAPLRKLRNKFPGKVSINLKFDPKLAQLIYAGSDMLLVPSRYEPCGLIQMIAMRYGTAPIVRKTGGLADTVKNKVTGFTFGKYTLSAMLEAVKTALKFYQSEKKWAKIVEKVMTTDFSWRKSAREYLELYREMLKLK